MIVKILRITSTPKTLFFPEMHFYFFYNQPADWRAMLIITYFCQKLKEKYLLAKL